MLDMSENALDRKKVMEWLNKTFLVSVTSQQIFQSLMFTYERCMN